MAMVRIQIVEGADVVWDSVFSPKVFSTGRKGYFANGKVVVNGLEHNANLMLTLTDVSKQRSGESVEAYNARMTELAGKNAKSASRNGPVRVVRQGTGKA